MKEIKKKRRGKPETGRARKHDVHCKMSSEERFELDRLCNLTNKSITDVIVDSMKFCLQIEENKIRSRINKGKTMPDDAYEYDYFDEEISEEDDDFDDFDEE